MITKEESFCLSCDNCGEGYTDEHNGFSLFVDESQALEHADNDGWYSHGDGEHEGKHYCPLCHKMDEEIDDLVIVDATRKKVETDLFGNKVATPVAIPLSMQEEAFEYEPTTEEFERYMSDMIKRHGWKEIKDINNHFDKKREEMKKFIDTLTSGKCTKPDCNCIEMAEAKNGGNPVKEYPCLAKMNEDLGALKTPSMQEEESKVIRSSFKFDNGKRIMVMTGSDGIKSFECNEYWLPVGKPFAECPLDWSGRTAIEYHFFLRNTLHKADFFVAEASTDLNSNS